VSFKSTITTNTDQNPAVVAQPAAAPKSPLAPAANDIQYATDARGRRIGCKKLSAIELFDLTGAMGDHSGNKSMLNQAMIAASVVEIDGMYRPRPITWAQLRAQITLLDFDGYVAVSEALSGAPAVTVNKDAVRD
jgi:hypothetical protein